MNRLSALAITWVLGLTMLNGAPREVGVPQTLVLAGRVTTESGAPLPGLRVLLMHREMVNGQEIRRPMPGAVTTDAEGRFIFTVPNAGSFYIWVSSGAVQTRDGRTLAYGSTYYPGTADGDAVTIAAGESRLDLNFQLRANGGSHIRGRVESSAGHGIESAVVGLSFFIDTGDIGIMSVINGRVPRTLTAADGTFEFPDLGRGHYRVHATAPIGDAAAAFVDVADTDVNDVVLRPQPSASITGVVRTDDGSLPPFASSGVYVRLLRDSASRLGTMANDWSFDVPANTGYTRLRLDYLPNGWTMKAVRVNGREMPETGVLVRGGSRIEDVELVIARKR